jgi:hypothetical protein
LAVLIGTAAGEIEVSVGGGGLVMETVTAFDVVVDVVVVTVTVALPTEVNRLAGT